MKIAVFRTGTHTDSAGNQKTWTQGDLDTIVAKYDPAQHEAPAVIGHPKTNAPAYGWVQSLERAGDILWAEVKPTVEEFTDWLKKGLFKKRSISLNPDGSLRHIGFLGATPPAVKGLPDFSFSSEGAETIEFGEGEMGRITSRILDAANKERRTTMDFWGRVKERLNSVGISFKEMFGSDNPPVLFTEQDINAKLALAEKGAKEAVAAEFAEKERALKDREAALNRQAAEARKKGIHDFVEGLKKKGVIVPAMEKLGMGITSFLEAVSGLETTIDFAEADNEGKRAKQTPLEFAEAFLGSLPKAIEFKEVAKAEGDPGSGNAQGKFQRLVTEYCEKNKDASYKDAVLAVSREHKELYQETKEG